MNDFIVNSKGHCFLCLDKISNTSVKHEGNADTISLYKLHCLSRHLKMDLTKVFSQKGSIPSSLIAKVEQSRLKVELCKECASLTNSFSSLYRQWEKLGMEMGSKVDHIQQKLLKAEKSGRMESLRDSVENEGLFTVLDVLRLEAIKKSSSNSSNHKSPRIKIRKLTRQEIKSHEKSKALDGSPTPVLATHSNDEENMDIKNEDLGWNDDDGNDISYEIGGRSDDNDDDGSRSMPDPEMTDMPLDTEETRKPIAISKKAEGVVSQSMPQTAIKNVDYCIDPKTNKYKCKLCLKEFTQQGFYYHYKSFHLNVRYKCNLCGKIFSTRPSFNRHIKSAHLGVRFKCLLCNQQFTSKRSLERHQRSNTCQT